MLLLGPATGIDALRSRVLSAAAAANAALLALLPAVAPPTTLDSAVDFASEKLNEGERTGVPAAAMGKESCCPLPQCRCISLSICSRR